MTDTVTVTRKPKSVFGTDAAAGAAQFLQPLVVNLTAMSVDGKQAHWHVRGPNFIGIHELLDVYVDHVREWADLIAERVVALGLPVDGRIATVATGTTTPAVNGGFQRSDQLIAQVVAQIDATLDLLHTGIAALDSIDVASQDVLVEVERGLVKDRWFLHAHIAEA